ncbi:MAG: alpha/beta hydrolase family protein [Pyrinomonadaceae bacterium]
MAIRRRFGKKLFRLLLPILLILVTALVIVLVWIVYGITNPPRRSYLVTPATYSTISGTGRALRVTEESWRNRDGTAARGWLLRGAEGAPAVVFLHRYGGDRSLLLNLGMKVNEAINCTILWPDLRGHALNPSVKWTSFGSREGDDVLAALDFLRSLKGEGQNQLIGDRVGVYGVELGAYAALRAASSDAGIQVLVLDSVPRNQNDLVEAAVRSHARVNTSALVVPARIATWIYFFRQYDNKSSCDLAGTLGDRRVFLLAGEDDGYLRESTKSLAPCFSSPANLETRTDLRLSGFTLPSATGEQGEGYDRPVIDFFVKNLH